MRQAVELVGIVNLVLFAAIAVVCVRQWSSERAQTALWAALAFVDLAAVMVVGQLLPDEPQGFAENALQRVDLAVLVLFPYLLYRFAVAFEATERPLAPYIDVLTSGLVAVTFVLPHLPATGDSWPWWFAAYVIVFVIHWSVLLLVVAVRLWRAGRTEASVARHRMQMLAIAATAITAALVLAAAGGEDDDSLRALATGLLATLSAVAFILGFAPPIGLRLLWRRPEQERMRLAIGELMSATSEQDVADRVLPSMARMVGAHGIALDAADGSRIAEHGSVDDRSNGDVRRLEFPFGTLVIRTSTFAPFFGAEERKLLITLGSLMSVALDRARLFTQERTARASLERVDELKSQFVSLAAHELRSPVGAIYGLSETLAERKHQLPADQVAELEVSLTQQIRRLRVLVEQLLDLSRLDARAVVIKPQRVRIRERLEEIVDAASLESVPIGIDVDPELEVEVDTHALDRIVTNLLANACRYGAPPVMVSAAQVGELLRVTVQDHGPGVPSEFVPLLFDRFARSAASASSVPGTGLGLAIARSYARAHSGEVSYRPAASSGSVFELTLPTAAAW